jgi:hypothetical protein
VRSRPVARWRPGSAARPVSHAPKRAPAPAYRSVPLRGRYSCRASTSTNAKLSHALPKPPVRPSSTRQSPSRQRSVAAHVRPHAPQLEASYRTSTQRPPQSRSGATQPQAPLVHSSRGPHATPSEQVADAPQYSASEPGSMQRPPQRYSPAGHASMHRPARQNSPPVQGPTPPVQSAPRPQCSRSESGSMQRPKHRSKPGSQSPTHRPPTQYSVVSHTAPPLHVSGDAPQWSRSVEGSTQDPSQFVRPGAHSIVQAPPTQISPSRQRVKRSHEGSAPQYASLSLASTQAPSHIAKPGGHGTSRSTRGASGAAPGEASIPASSGSGAVGASGCVCTAVQAARSVSEIARERRMSDVSVFFAPSMPEDLSLARPERVGAPSVSARSVGARRERSAPRCGSPSRRRSRGCEPRCARGVDVPRAAEAPSAPGRS